MSGVFVVVVVLGGEGGFSSEDRTVNLAEVKVAAVLCLRQAASNWVMIL